MTPRQSPTKLDQCRRLVAIVIDAGRRSGLAGEDLLAFAIENTDGGWKSYTYFEQIRRREIRRQLDDKTPRPT